MSEVECQVRFILNPEAQAVTVGERFQLQCQSQVPWPEGDLRFEVPESAKYQLRLLNLERLSDNSVDLSVTSVAVGEHRIEGAKIGGRDLPVVTVKVQSVQDPSNPVKEPYGPMLLDVNLPPLFPVAVLGIILLLSLLFMVAPWFKKRRDKRIMNIFYTKCRSDLSPTEEFFKTIREIKKNSVVWDQKEMLTSSDQVRDLYKSYFTALQKLVGRTFDWPLTEMSPKVRQRYVSLLNEIEHEAATDLVKLWFETERNELQDLRGQDLSYMLDWSLKLAPQLPLLKRLNG